MDDAKQIGQIAHDVRGFLQVVTAKAQMVFDTTQEPQTKRHMEVVLAACQKQGEKLTSLLSEEESMTTPPALRCLVAEDEPTTREYLSYVLTKQGHCVVQAVASSEEMIAAAMHHRPDMIIFDIHLAPNEGDELATHSDGLHAFTQIVKDIPTVGIAITGSTDSSLIRKATEEWVFNYLIKPVGDLQLIAAVSMAHARQEQFRQVQAEADRAADQLADAKLVNQAKHIIMKKFTWSEDRAYKYIQRTAKQQRIKMRELAVQIIEETSSSTI